MPGRASDKDEKDWAPHDEKSRPISQSSQSNATRTGSSKVGLPTLDEKFKEGKAERPSSFPALIREHYKEEAFVGKTNLVIALTRAGASRNVGSL